MARVAHAVESWISSRAPGLRPRTIEHYQSLLRLHIGPSIGSRKVADLKPKHIARLYNDLLAVGHGRTAEACYVLLHAALPDCPAVAAVARPAYQRRDPRWWSPDELRQFVSQAAADGGQWAVCWQLALCCGLRRGELAGLRWSDIDMSAGVLHVRNQRQRVAGEGVIDAPPKSAAGRRDIPLPEAVLHMLSDWRLVVEASQTLSGGQICPYVLVSALGTGIEPHAINKALDRAIQRAGVRPINLHGLRHTMASLAVAMGVHVRVLQDLLGHSSLQVTASTYTHISQSLKREAIDAISRGVL